MRKLKDILDSSENMDSMNIEHIIARRNQLNVLIDRPMVLVTGTFNVGSIGFVTNQDDFSDTLTEYANQNDWGDSDIEIAMATSFHL